MFPRRVVLVVAAVLAVALVPVARAAKIERTPRGTVVTYTDTIEAAPVEECVQPTERIVKLKLTVAVRRLSPRRIGYDLRLVAQLRRLPKPPPPPPCPPPAEPPEPETAEERAERVGPMRFSAFAQACDYGLNRERDAIGRIILGLGERDDVLTLRPTAEGRVAGRLRGEATMRRFVMPPNPNQELRVRRTRFDAVCFGLDEAGVARLDVRPADPDPRDVKRAETRPAEGEGEGGGEAPH